MHADTYSHMKVMWIMMMKHIARFSKMVYTRTQWKNCVNGIGNTKEKGGRYEEYK